MQDIVSDTEGISDSEKLDSIMNQSEDQTFSEAQIREIEKEKKLRA